MYIFVKEINAKKINIMRIEAINNERKELRKKVSSLVELKNKLFSNMNIESPMCKEEKNLTKEIASIYSKMNALVREKRNLLKNSPNEK